MWDFSVSGSVSAMIRTAPFIVLRLAVYFGVAFLYLLATGTGSAVGYGFTSFGDGEGAGAVWGGLIGFGGASGVLYWMREYILYNVKAGHIAVLVHVMDGSKLPHGRGQIEHAVAEVKARFATTTTLFAMDQIIKGVLRVLTGIVNTVAMILPIPGLDNLVKIVNAILKLSLTYVDEVILAHIIREKSENPWETGRQGLVLYAQNYGKLVKNAVWLWLFMWIVTIVIFLLLLAPILGLIALFPGDVGGWAFPVAFVFAWAFRAALIEPLVIYSLMQVYFKTIKGQVPDPVWEGRLESASKKFVEMKTRALSAVSGQKPGVPE